MVEFRTDDLYRYDYTAPGRAAVRAMKRIAVTGSGLANFTNQRVRAACAKKLR